MRIIRVNDEMNAPIRVREASGQRGSQLLEFAFTVPILLLLVVGAWDFGAKIVLRQKLTNAARDGARIIVSNSLRNTTNCTTAIPCTAVAAANAVKQYLTDAGVDASWITPAAPTSSTACSWTYNQTPGSSGAWVEINAGYVIISASGAPVPATQVTINWPVTWQLGGFLSGSDFAPGNIQTTVAMADLVGIC